MAKSINDIENDLEVMDHLEAIDIKLNRLFNSKQYFVTSDREYKASLEARIDYLKSALKMMIHDAQEGHFHSGGAADSDPAIKKALAALKEENNG